MGYRHFIYRCLFGGLFLSLHLIVYEQRMWDWLHESTLSAGFSLRVVAITPPNMASREVPEG